MARFGDHMNDFDDVIRRVQDASNAMFNGDPMPYMDAWSRNEPVSLMGAWGGHEEGWSSLGERFRWVAGRFSSGSAMRYEPILSYVGADVAYSVGIERGIANADDVTVPMAIRVTHIYRRQAGEWRLVHRH